MKRDMVEIVRVMDQRKYLNKKPPGNLRTRAARDAAHCCSRGWDVLKRDVSLKLRLE